MKLYKFRSLTRLDYVLDIVLNERLHCAHFSSLNDPMEGIYLDEHHVWVGDYVAVSPMQYARAASELPDSIDCCRICSLSESYEDLRLWSHYADGHRGVAIEIDFTGHEASAKPVDYLTELKKYAAHTVLGRPEAETVFRQKTIHWAYEAERRILQSATQIYYPINGRITAIILGTRTARELKSLIDKAVPRHVAMIETKINEKTLKVEQRGEFTRDTS